MRRPALIAVLVLLAVGGGAAQASADKVTLSAKTTTCTTGADDASRAAAFTGSMPAAAADQAHADALRAAPAQGHRAQGDLQADRGPGLERLGEVRSRPSGLRLHQARRGADGARRLPRGRHLPLAGRHGPRPAHARRARRRSASSPTRVRTSSWAASTAPRPARARRPTRCRSRNEGRADAEPFAVTITVDGTVPRRSRSARSSPAAADRHARRAAVHAGQHDHGQRRRRRHGRRERRGRRRRATRPARWHSRAAPEGRVTLHSGRS